MVHHANTRPNPDGTKVGGHQASSSSVVSLLTALYFHALRPGDVVATKAHASPAFYAIQYLRGRLTADELRRPAHASAVCRPIRAGARIPEIVDLSTGSMGLGAVRGDVRRPRRALPAPDHGGAGRARALRRHGRRRRARRGQRVGGAAARRRCAELGNVLWIVDVNRQSLDRVVPDAPPRASSAEMFRGGGWHVHRAALGLAAARALRAARRRAPARAARGACPTRSTSALLRLPAGGAAQGAGHRRAAAATDAALDRLLADMRGRGAAPRSSPTSAATTSASILERLRGGGPRARAALRDPGRHDQGLGLAVRRRPA